MKRMMNKISVLSIIALIFFMGLMPIKSVNAASFRVGDKIEGVIESEFIISPDNWSSSVAVGLSTPDSSENVNYTFEIEASDIFALDITTEAQYKDYLSKILIGFQGQYSPGSVIPDLDIISDGQDFYQTWAIFTISGDQLMDFNGIMIIVDNSNYFYMIPVDYLSVNITITIEREDDCPECEECPENSNLTIPGYVTVSALLFGGLAIYTIIWRIRKQKKG